MENLVSLKDQLRQLEEKHLKPDVRSSPEEIASILAKEFFEIGSSGKFFYRDEIVKEGALAPWDMSLSDFNIHPLADDVVLTTYRVEDKTRMRNTLRSTIWKLIDGSWQMFFHQGTIEL